MTERDPATFTHAPRLPTVPADFSGQRYYAANEFAAVAGVPTCRDGVRVQTMGFVGESHASITIITDHGRLAAELLPEQARELARCLIDAAADIEAEQAQRATGGAA